MNLKKNPKNQKIILPGADQRNIILPKCTNLSRKGRLILPQPTERIVTTPELQIPEFWTPEQKKREIILPNPIQNPAIG